MSKAADVLNYQRGTSAAIEALDYRYEGLERTALVADPRFLMERVRATGEPASMATENRPLIVMALDRALDLSAGGADVRLERYQTALIPAAAQWCTVRSSDNESAPFMLVTPPESPQTLPARLLAAGVGSAAIDRFMA